MLHNLCIDFDGVIHGYLTWDDQLTDAIVPGTKEALAELSTKFRLIVLTSRLNIGAVQDWLEKHDLAQYIADVTNRKVPAVGYIDDRGLRFTEWPHMLHVCDNALRDYAGKAVQE